MGIALRDVGVGHVRVGDHRLVDQVEIDHHLGGVSGVGVGRQRRLLAGPDLGDPLLGNADQPVQHEIVILHALVDHDLDAVLRDLERFDQRGILGNADRRLGLHLGRPVGEGEGLVGEQRADMHLDDAALEDVVAELFQHLRLGGVDDITEIHVVGHAAGEGDLYRLRNRHGRLAGGQRQRDSAGIGAEGHALGHARMGITADDDRPVIDRDVVQHLVDDVGHRVVLVLRITAGDQAEIMHELHQLRRVLGGLEVPDRRGVASRLVGAVDLRRDHGGGHRLQLLRRHRAGGVLRADDIDPHPHIRSGMQRGARRDADGIGVEDFFHRGQALPLDRDLLRRRESGFQRNAQRLAGEGLQHLAEDDGVGPAGADEFHLLRGEG